MNTSLRPMPTVLALCLPLLGGLPSVARAAGEEPCKVLADDRLVDPLRTIASGKTHAEAFAWVVEHRLKHTYPATAMRMLRELGGIREGICIDLGCGTGHLDVELAKRSRFTIIGLDVDPNMKPRFEKAMREAALEDRARFVLGDAQQLPFEDDYADAIVSRGTLIFIPDVAQCLREVDRVLDDGGQWVEIRKGLEAGRPRD